MGHAKESPEPGRGVPEASGARGGRAEPLEKALGGRRKAKRPNVDSRICAEDPPLARTVVPIVLPGHRVHLRPTQSHAPRLAHARRSRRRSRPSRAPCSRWQMRAQGRRASRRAPAGGAPSCCNGRSWPAERSLGGWATADGPPCTAAARTRGSLHVCDLSGFVCVERGFYTFTAYELLQTGPLYHMDTALCSWADPTGSGRRLGHTYRPRSLRGLHGDGASSWSPQRPFIGVFGERAAWLMMTEHGPTLEGTTYRQ